MQPFLLILLVLAVMPVPMAVGASQVVYKTVENGITVFSDTPPGVTDPGAVEVFVLPVASAREDKALEQRLAEMRDTTNRMAADRREREERRQQRAENQRELQVPRSASKPTLTEQDYAPSGVWVGSSRVGRGYGHGYGLAYRARQGYSYKHGYPTAVSPSFRLRHRPPLMLRKPRAHPHVGTAQVYAPTSGASRSGWSVVQSGNSQLMRPIVSSRR